MHLTPSSSPRMAKSTSLSILEHDGEMHIVDQDDIIGLTLDVKNFSDGLARLKCIFSEPCECDEDMRVLAHERLGDALCTLKSVLQKYPPLNTTELFSAAGTLIGNIKSYDYEGHSTASMEVAFSDAIDQLALEFSKSVSDYLMGDLQHGAVEEMKTKSYDNLLSVSQDTTDKDETEDEKEEPVVLLTAEQIDSVLMNLQSGLETAFSRAKAWSKYLKDVMSYIERRAQLELEYSKNLSRLASSVKPALTDEGYLPLQSVYCTVLSQDVEYSKNCQATFTLLQTTKFVEPLTARRGEHDKVRKALKELWNKEVKKMQEAVSNFRKAQSMYITRQQEFEKARELSLKTESELSHSNAANIAAKIDKRKKAEEDSWHKAAETETTYKACVAEANYRQTELQKVKSELLSSIREQIYLSDTIIKTVTIEYFQLLHTVSAPVPVQYHTLCEASKKYEPGSQYGEYVRRLPVSVSTSVQHDDFKFEPYNTRGEVGNRKVSTQSNDSMSSDHHSREGSPNISSPRRDKYRVKAWQGIVVNSDTDSQSGSSKSLDSSPSNSPFPSGHKKMVLAGSMDDLIEDQSGVSAGVKQLLAVPGTEQVDVQSILKRQGRRRNTTFGVDFQEQVEHYHSAIPPIISKCLKEVEKRGITVKGIYRVSGVKSTVENLCQKFEMDPESVNLDNENPNVISNVLKLYLRQLPEPLLTFKLYQGFVHTAKENMSASIDKGVTIEKLHELIDKLPFSNRKTCGVLMHHLQRVASFSDKNQMNASNLGIVFGPTLLRPQGGNASLACLVDTPHQTRVVELLIVNAITLFGPNDDHQLFPGETPVETIYKRATLQVPQQATIELPKEDNKQKREPKKETIPSPTISLVQSKEQILPPNIPQPSAANKDNTHIKKSREEFHLPGSTHFDRKENLAKSVVPYVSHGHMTSEGEDNNLDNGLDNENSADSDIHSDDDLLLPDDSLQSSQNTQHETGSQYHQEYTGGRIVIHRTESYMTPPFTPRHFTRPLPSPASSPNLSIRSAATAPPAIRIDDSVPSSPDDASSSSVPSSQSKIYQLPPVNSWVPKGESMFNGILDSRSPQVYRRTAVGSKTASYPQTSQPLGAPQSSRVSWPQGSQSQLSPPMSPPMSPSRSDMHASKESELKQLPKSPSRSPKLLRKCTSFDLERSKPFPARSKITSPMPLRKSGSSDEPDTASAAKSPKAGKEFNVDGPNKAHDHVLREDEAEFAENTNDMLVHQCKTEVPQCISGDGFLPPQYETSIDSKSGNSAVKNLVLSSDEEFDVSKLDQSLEDANLRETDILDDDFDEPELDQAMMKCKNSTQSDLDDKWIETQSTGFEAIHLDVDMSSSLEIDTQSKKQQAKSNPSKTDSGQVKKKGKDKSKEKNEIAKSQSGPIREKSSRLKSGNKEGPSDKLATKTATSSVRSALLTSAAKLKSIGKKSPVTLLSYKSKSISIPDHSQKASRPSSTSCITPDTKKRLVHQTESSPTVMVASNRETELKTEFKIDGKSVKSDKVGVKAKKQSTVQTGRKTDSPSSASSEDKSRKSANKQEPATYSSASALDKLKKKDRWATTFKASSSDRVVKSSLSRSYTSEKQEQKPSLSSKASTSSRSPITSSSQANKQSKTTKVKSSKDLPRPRSGKEGLTTKSPDEKTKLKDTKRGSISSVHSETSRKSDHFVHDCCHGRKKTSDKK